MAAPPPDPKAMQQQAAGKRLQQTQAQVNEVVDIMRVNVDKVLERDNKLSELDSRADHLQAGASQFEASAGKLKRKFWWKNMKMWLILIGVIVAIILIIVVWVVVTKKGQHQPQSTISPSQTTAATTSLSPNPPSGEGQ